MKMKEKVEKVYILMFGFSNVVAGGPIYDSNKIRFLESKGWNVVVFPVDSGKVYIADLKRFKGKAFDFIRYYPFFFTKKQIKLFLNCMVSLIPDADQIVIETGTDYTSLWGELLAETIGAKHIVFFLDEKNDNVNKYSAPFYRFKYERNELAAISERSLTHIFSPYMKIDFPQRYVLKAWCSNSVRSIPTDLLDHIPKTDFLVGSIGRLEKGYVEKIVESVCTLAANISDRLFGLVLIGGTDNTEVIYQLKCKVENFKNVKLYITGYVWPIPESIFNAFDLFISAAGSASVSANMNITTIKLDVISYEPIGFIEDPVNNVLGKCKLGNKLTDYIYQALIDKDVPGIINRQSPENLWNTICGDFEKHLDFIAQSEKENVYYPVRNIWNHGFIQIIKKFVFSIFSYKNTIKIQSLYGKAIKQIRNVR